MKNRIKAIVLAFLAMQIVWQLMNSGLAFGQMALLDLAFRMLLVFVYSVTAVVVIGD